MALVLKSYENVLGNMALVSKPYENVLEKVALIFKPWENLLDMTVPRKSLSLTPSTHPLAHATFTESLCLEMICAL